MVQTKKPPVAIFAIIEIGWNTQCAIAKHLPAETVLVGAALVVVALVAVARQDAGERSITAVNNHLTASDRPKTT